ncbi:MAG: PspA/IM30 family protein, partial [Jiangellaceae bacterium]
EEARVRGQAELAASSLDSQFESLEDLDRQAEIEARLAELKAGSGGGAAVAAAPAAPALGSGGDEAPGSGSSTS